MPVIIAGASLGIISYIVGRADYSSYLDVHYIKGSGEIIYSLRLIGRVGISWYNTPPAAVFMGDTGSLSMGSALGCIAVSVNMVLIVEVIRNRNTFYYSGIIFKYGRRMFLMAPIHHHFEKLGWSES